MRPLFWLLLVCSVLVASLMPLTTARISPTALIRQAVVAEPVPFQAQTPASQGLVNHDEDDQDDDEGGDDDSSLIEAGAEVESEAEDEAETGSESEADRKRHHKHHHKRKKHGKHGKHGKGGSSTSTKSAAGGSKAASGSGGETDSKTITLSTYVFGLIAAGSCVVGCIASYVCTKIMDSGRNKR